MESHKLIDHINRARVALHGEINARGVVTGIALAIVILLMSRILSGYSGNILDNLLGRPTQIPLKELIRKVKDDLSAAETEGIAKGETPLLSLQEVELEVTFAVQAKSESEVKLVAVNGMGTAELGQTHRVKLRLVPVAPESSSVLAQSAPVIPKGASGIIGHSPPGSKVK
ncbi:MAG: trypco2 family protein [Leptothrix sp. (in: b-proteobacteria)]